MLSAAVPTTVDAVARSAAMKWNRLVVFTLCCIIAAMVVVALKVGPPRSPADEPLVVANARPAASVSPSPASFELHPEFAGVIVRSFGPMPGCGDDVAISAIVAMARSHSSDTISGLADIHSLGHSQVGNLTQWDCDAQVQRGRGEQRVHYQINELTAGPDSWEITILGTPARFR